MIRVVRDEAATGGTFGYRVGGAFAYAGRSRQPLLDACRVVKSMGGDPAAKIGLFRSGRTEADLVTTVGYGARWTIDEKRLNFAPWKPFAEDRRPERS